MMGVTVAEMLGLMMDDDSCAGDRNDQCEHVSILKVILMELWRCRC